MKPLVIRYKGLFCLLLFFLVTSLVFAQNGENFITINGIVKDQRNRTTLEYVNISVPGTNIGTITNTDGEFSLKISKAYKDLYLEISHIGYITCKLPLKPTGGDKHIFYLNPNSIILDEVIVSPVYPRKLVEQAIDKIEDNYNPFPSMLTGFYRETSQKGRKYINVTEAVTKLYKTAYKEKEGITRDRVKIEKGRQLVSPKQGDTLGVKLIGGPTLAISLDVIKNRDELLDKETLYYYEFKFDDLVLIDNQLHYVISFTPMIPLPYPLYRGKLYINKQTLAFTRAELSIDMRDKEKVTRMILRKKPAGLIFKPMGLSTLLTFKEQNGRTYLNYVRNEIKFKCDWKKKWFHTNYAVVSEMVITDREDNPNTTISSREAFRDSQVLSDKVGNFYDEKFWGDYNIIEPTESLERAVNKLRKAIEDP